MTKPAGSTDLAISVAGWFGTAPHYQPANSFRHLNRTKRVMTARPTLRKGS
jgi:hypothetical protein